MKQTWEENKTDRVYRGIFCSFHCAIARTRSRFIGRTRGFTLIEVVMTMTITSVIALVIAPVLFVGIEGILHHIDRADLEESVNVAFSRMSREIRRLRDAESVILANGMQFAFFDVNNIIVLYFLSGNDIRRFEFPPFGATEELINNVQATTGLAFTYLDDSGNTIATPTVGVGTTTNIRRIQIRITLERNAHTVPYQITIQPRNLPHESNRFF